MSGPTVKSATTRSNPILRYRLAQAEWGCVVAGVIVVIASGAIYRAALHQGLASDFPADVEFTARGIRTGVFPGNFLLEALMASVALFRTGTPELNISLFIVLALATGTKALLSSHFVISEDRTATGVTARGFSLAALIAAAALCSFAFSLPAQHLYLGSIPPNVWHNPSTILLMPFALALFWSSLHFLRDGRPKWLWISFALGALNIAAKPSFVLCFLPVFSGAALLRFGIQRKSGEALLLVAAIASMLGAQYVYVFVVHPAGSTLTSSSGVVVAPLSVWNHYTTEIPLALVASYLFPVVAVALGGHVVWRNQAVRYALALALVGLAEYALLAEQGARELEGNLTWQAIVTQYILFLTLIASFSAYLKGKRWGLRQVVIAIVFGAYIWSGAHFLLHWFAIKSYV
jgi:hypothetical protein